MGFRTKFVVEQIGMLFQDHKVVSEDISSSKNADRVPFFRPAIGPEELDAAARVIRSGWLTTGPESEAFEHEFAAFIGSDVAAVAVNSCTAGLHLVLEASRIGYGDQVLVPDLTFTATAEVVRYVGADPVFVDIDSATLCMDLSAAEAAITAQTKAIIPVHMAGLSIDLTAVYELAARHNLAVFEDAAHALPATYKGTLIGGHNSDAVVFSFYANKTLTSGEGGMIVSRDKRLLDHCRAMRSHGIDRDVHDRFSARSSKWRYDVIAPGFKYNLSDVLAAIGREQLKKARKLHSLRLELARFYDDTLCGLPLILPPRAEDTNAHAWHLYIVRLMDGTTLDRDEFLSRLDNLGIGYSVHYTPLHRLRYWRESYGLSDDQFPETTDYFKRCISLPFYPTMSLAERVRTVAAVGEALRA